MMLHYLIKLCSKYKKISHTFLTKSTKYVNNQTLNKSFTVTISEFIWSASIDRLCTNSYF